MRLLSDLLKGADINSSGYGIIPKLIMQDQGLDIGAKAVYAYFASFAGSGNTCFPSRDKICLDLNVSKNTLGKYITQLIEGGYIAVEQEKENGRFSRNIYTLLSEVTPQPKKPYTETPCPKNSDTEKTGHQNLPPNNNNLKNNNSLKNNSSKRDVQRFVKPTLEEIRAYCQERKNNVDPQRFLDYYESNGWKVGRNPMKDWKATVRTWERNTFTSKPAKQVPSMDYGSPEDFYR